MHSTQSLLKKANTRHLFPLLLLALLCFCPACSHSAKGLQSFTFEDPADYPLMGNWEGKWINADRGAEAHNPAVCAQLILQDPGVYQLVILPRHFRRARPYMETTVREQDGQIQLDAHGWKGTFKDGAFKGVAPLHGQTVEFEMKRVDFISPTLGREPPPGAVVLFEGSNVDHWEHHDGRDVTWKLVEDDVMEVVSGFWNDNQNRKDGLGGDIRTQKTFNSLRMHLEFRYPVEPGMRGQGLGNSGLFFHGIGELQILNSYGSNGYWDEGGSFYHIMPPKINAAAPPLVWQTYDVELWLPEYDPTSGEKRSDAEVTVYHNGHLIHNRTVIPTGHRGPVRLGLQDHINKIQFRNIWVKERLEAGEEIE